jgi:TonB family protein
MTVDPYSNLLALAGGQQPVGQPVKWTFFVSLALHLCVLTLIFGLRFSPKLERPSSTYHVSLVTLPSTSRVTAPASLRPVEAEQAAPVPAPPTPSHVASAGREASSALLPPAPAQMQPAAPPRQRVKEAPPKMPTATAPKVAPVPAFPSPQEMREVRRSAENPLRDALRGIELPPEAPKLGNVKPTPAVAGKSIPPPSQKEIQKLLSNLAVPDVTGSPKSLPEVPQTSQARKSPADESNKQLQAKVTGLKKPETGIEVPGVAPNRYLALIQSKISNQWIAPPVDLSGKSLRVVVRFRLDRTGNVSDIVIETSSGNGYYDDAGRRAVLKAGRLPSFPPEMTEPFLDTHFSFAVGEEAG